MTRPATVDFTKMHGAGNDFLVLDNRSYGLDDDTLADLAATWCPRRYGVGADGLLALNPPETDAEAFRMRYVNADGSWATMCGNGARCLVRFAEAAGVAEGRVAFQTDAGRYHAEVRSDDRVRLFVPPATRTTLDLALSEPLPQGLDAVHFIHTGTEHLVTFATALDEVPVEQWGRRLRADPRVSPPGANVNFVSVPSEDANRLRVRTYEKGVEAETLACGTGVLAAAEVARRTGRVTGTPITVQAAGGTLHVGTAAAGGGEKTYLEGPAVTVYQGTIALR
jgi:diaminopimelate epimerase